VPLSGEENEFTDFTVHSAFLPFFFALAWCDPPLFFLISQTRGKLYVFDAEEKKDWRERGVGVIKLNSQKSGGSSRLGTMLSALTSNQTLTPPALFFLLESSSTPNSHALRRQYEIDPEYSSL